MSTLDRILAFDVGDKRIGIAVSDPLRITAQGLETYIRRGDEKDIAHICALEKQYAPCTIVFGMPRNMNGTYGPQSEKVREFARLVEEKSDNKIQFYDERLTTIAAERVLLDADVSRKKRKKVIDKMAAVVILQNYMDYIKFQQSRNEIDAHQEES